MNFLQFIGIDKNILEYCPKDEQLLYKIFNLLQIALIVIVGFSSYYLFEVIFDITILSIVLALFWAFIFYNLYRFILMTTSGKKGEVLKDKISIWLPNTIKIVIVAFFAIFISLPIELFVNKEFIETNLPKSLEQKIQVVNVEIDSIYYTEYYEIESKIIDMRSDLKRVDSLIAANELKMQETKGAVEQRDIFMYLHRLHLERVVKEEKYRPLINGLLKELALVEGEKQKDVNQYISIISNSNLLLERFNLLFENKAFSSSFLAGIIVLLFLLPLLYKFYSVYSQDSQYEKVVADRNKHEILYHYHLFKERYKDITKEILGEETDFAERYNDPPFNTIKKVDQIKKELKGNFSQDLIKKHEANK